MSPSNEPPSRSDRSARSARSRARAPRKPSSRLGTAHLQLVVRAFGVWALLLLFTATVIDGWIRVASDALTPLAPYLLDRELAWTESFAMPTLWLTVGAPVLAWSFLTTGLERRLELAFERRTLRLLAGQLLLVPAYGLLRALLELIA